MNLIDSFNEFLADEHPDLPAMPTHNVVCHRCKGEGVLGGFPGVYTRDDFDSGDVDLEEYLDYSRTCEKCEGVRVLKVAEDDGLDHIGDPGLAETVRMWHQWQWDEAEHRAQIAAEQRMGA